MSTAARRRGQWLRAAARHERQSIRMAMAELHHWMRLRQPRRIGPSRGSIFTNEAVGEENPTANPTAENPTAIRTAGRDEGEEYPRGLQPRVKRAEFAIHSGAASADGDLDASYNFTDFDIGAIDPSVENAIILPEAFSEPEQESQPTLTVECAGNESVNDLKENTDAALEAEAALRADSETHIELEEEAAVESGR